MGTGIAVPPYSEVLVTILCS